MKTTIERNLLFPLSLWVIALALQACSAAQTPLGASVAPSYYPTNSYYPTPTPTAGPVAGYPYQGPDIVNVTLQVLGGGGTTTVASNPQILDFGGMYGYVNGNFQGNPLTGGGCPGGYNAVQVLGTNNVDWSLFYCEKSHQSGVAAQWDFGGLLGYVNNTPTPLSSCPSGFTPYQVMGQYDVDWPLSFCYKTHSGGDSEPFNFGGMYGYVNGSQAGNVATGGMSCPGGYASYQAYGTPNNTPGTPGYDYSLFYCAQ